jgi:ABC-type dipeptide/oligopeptide/nickel transport system permease component
VVVAKDLRNVPRSALVAAAVSTPGNTGIETYWFTAPAGTAADHAQLRHELTTVTTVEQAGGGTGGTLILTLLIIGLLAGLGLIACRHPFVARRLVIMIPTLAVISVIVFTIVQLPPSNFLDNRIAELRLQGEESAIRQIEDLKATFRPDDPAVTRYCRWLGLPWFVTWAPRDRGLLQGQLGWSMESNSSVNDIIGDRITLTFILTLGTILFTWIVAFAIGTYSAVRQYSLGDYTFSLLGFIGMSVPNFLLALILMYWARAWFGVTVTGLHSPAYAGQAQWTWGKFADLMQHLWLPVVVIGVGGTAGMIRVMRGNLLDELRKPYVTTARAKGVRPLRLLFKYPVRIALNPFVSGIGGIFPELVSGGAIVSLVLSLPTVGPKMLDALQTEDMYLAGSMLMILSLLGVCGTLVSDLLLLWLDPRIRFEGKAAR